MHVLRVLLHLALCGLYCSLSSAQTTPDGDGKPQAAGAAPGQHPVRCDFEAAFAPVTPPASATPRISGELPAGWQDNSAWAEVSVRYYRCTEDAHEGTAALRVQAASITSGRVQFTFGGLPDLRQRFLKISAAAKSPTAMSFTFAIFPPEGQKWRLIWSQSFSGNLEWTAVQALVPPIVDQANVRFAVLLETPGTLDLDDFIFELSDPPAPPATLTKNLLASSVFPDGVPGGVLANRIEDCATDRGTLGPSGLPALRARAVRQDDGRERFVLTSPFVYAGGQKHTLSIAAKSAAHGQKISLQMAPYGEEIFAKAWRLDLDLSTEWQRYEFTVTLPYSSAGFALARVAVLGGGEVWLDSWQVERADAMGEFVRSGPVELTLHPATTMGLVLQENALEFTVTAVGQIEMGAVLKGTLTDVYGRRIELPDLALPEQGLYRHPIKLTGLGEVPLGAYRVEMRAVAGERVLSRPAEVLLTRVRKARDGDRFLPNSPFGVHARRVEHLCGTLRQLGFTWVRTFNMLEWDQIEPRPGEYQFAEADREVELLRKHNLLPLGILTGSPRWASNRPENYRVYSQWAPKDPGQFARFAGAVAEHFKGRVDHLEVWNEPYWQRAYAFATDDRNQPVIAPPEHYVATQAAAYRAIKAANPECRVAWVVNFVNSFDYCAKVVNAGVSAHMDLLCYHQYVTTSPEATLDKHLALIRQQVPEAGKRIPVWNSEGGQGPVEPLNFYAHTPPFNMADRSVHWSEFLVRYYLACLGNGTEKFFIYCFDEPSFWRAPYCLLNVDGRLNPVAAALSNLFWHLEGKKLHSLHETSAGRRYLFADDRSSVLVLVPNPAAEFTLTELPPKTVARDLFGNALPLPVMLRNRSVFLEIEGEFAPVFIDGLLRGKETK